MAVIFCKQMFEKYFHFRIRCGIILENECMFGKYVRYKTEEGNEMTNTASTTHRTGRKESRKLSRTMAVILGLIVTLEVMIAGGMIFNIDFHSADTIAVILGFLVLYSGVVAVLTDN